jgi:hypothetical protein
MRLIETLIQRCHQSVETIIAIAQMFFDRGFLAAVSCAAQVGGKIKALQAHLTILGLHNQLLKKFAGQTARLFLSLH